MKVKTAEATGKRLDYGLAKALKLSPIVHKTVYNRPNTIVQVLKSNHQGSQYYKEFSHSDPTVCLGLMSQHEIDVTWGTSGKAFVQICSSDDDKWHGGKTLAEAVARCVIAMKFGDEFECPDELESV